MMKSAKTQNQTTRPLVLTGTGLLAMALLAGCSSNGTSNNTEATPAPATVTTTAPASPSAGSSDDADDTSSSPAASSSSPAASGDDPVFGALDAVQEQYADGKIISVDREDDDTMWDVDVVVGDRVIELDVLQDGTVREDEQDDDSDDIARSKEATVDIRDAINTALRDQPEGVTLDDASLDTEDGRLIWEIELDGADGHDFAELYIDAKDGSVISQH